MTTYMSQETYDAIHRPAWLNWLHDIPRLIALGVVILLFPIIIPILYAVWLHADRQGHNKMCRKF